MAKPDSNPRPLALIATRPVSDAQLATALRDDLTELLQFIRLRVVSHESVDELAKAAAVHDGPCLLTFSDVPGLPADCVEGAIEMLEDVDVVLGPCADGSVYLIAAEGLDEAGINALIDAALSPDGLARCIPLLEQAGLETATMPPWFRISGEKDVSFADSLARLSLMSEQGENDFIADRLRVWLEKRDQP